MRIVKQDLTLLRKI
ncbi:hypothetical protein CGLO_08400 [Colletotrichum gloeosporioides Cg-14]|uniref:Uncharacterized protein n=1 Tax=Colletotrichum gloeosporioides (strain Cg-14) TaxID=1237896 RepID=T0LUP6_COLGC|nr:hypothetical protein CGLO_08400 [Colletotrichum gloeosporioides Cg-14]